MSKPYAVVVIFPDDETAADVDLILAQASGDLKQDFDNIEHNWLERREKLRRKILDDIRKANKK